MNTLLVGQAAKPIQKTRLPRILAKCDHFSYVRKGKSVCTFCEWNEPLKRASYRYRDIMKGARSGTRWPIHISQAAFEQWYCREAAKLDACHYCGVTRLQLRDEGSHLCSWHIDRVNNAMFYDVGNLVLACDHCNTWKGARRTYEETVAHGASRWRGR